MICKYYTYVLISRKDHKFYVGYTENLKQRFELHNSGGVQSTKYRVPLDIVYYEVCYNKSDAIHREKYLKTTFGRRYIRHRIKNYLMG